MISRYSAEPVVRRPAAVGAGRQGRRGAGGIRAADAREGRRQPGVVQHVRGRHRGHHAQPWTMTCTDGDLVPMGEGVPHPRAYGAFARKLKRYVSERNAVDIAAAIRSMTTLPATVFGLKDRGQLRAGRVRRHPDFRSGEGQRRRHLRETAPALRRLRRHHRQRRAGAAQREVHDRAGRARAPARAAIALDSCDEVRLRRRFVLHGTTLSGSMRIMR